MIVAYRCEECGATWAPAPGESRTPIVEGSYWLRLWPRDSGPRVQHCHDVKQSLLGATSCVPYDAIAVTRWMHFVDAVVMAFRRLRTWLRWFLFRISWRLIIATIGYFAADHVLPAGHAAIVKDACFAVCLAAIRSWRITMATSKRGALGKNLGLFGVRKER